MNRPPKISVKHFLNKKAKGQSIFPIYYYITIKRRTITKPSCIGYSTETDFESGKYNAQINKEVEELTAICEKFISDFDNGKIERGLLEYSTLGYQAGKRRGFNSKDDFTNGLNMYIEAYTQPFVDFLNECINAEIICEFVDKFKQRFNCEAFIPTAQFKISGFTEENERELQTASQHSKLARFFEIVNFWGKRGTDEEKEQTLFCFDNIENEPLKSTMYIIGQINIIVRQWEHAPTLLDYYRNNLLDILAKAIIKTTAETEKQNFIAKYKPQQPITKDLIHKAIDRALKGYEDCEGVSFIRLINK